MPRGGKREGAGRKPTGRKYSTRSITLHDDEWKELEEKAKDFNTTPTRLAAEIVRQALQPEDE